MGSNTSLIGWPFPVSSDLIAQGAVNIEQLSEAVEGQFFLPTDAHNQADPYTVYPSGMSIMGTSGSSDWGAAFVITYRNLSGSWVMQYVCPRTGTTANQTLKLRFGFTGSGGPTWSGWDTLAGPGSPDAFASGAATVPVTGGEVSSITVTFPAGRFDYAPAVFTQYRGGSPGVSTSPSSVTNTSFTLNVMRSTSTDAYVYWQAVSNQGE